MSINPVLPASNMFFSPLSPHILTVQLIKVWNSMKSSEDSPNWEGRLAKLFIQVFHNTDKQSFHISTSEPKHMNRNTSVHTRVMYSNHISSFIQIQRWSISQHQREMQQTLAWERKHRNPWRPNADWPSISYRRDSRYKTRKPDQSVRKQSLQRLFNTNYEEFEEFEDWTKDWPTLW